MNQLVGVPQWSNNVTFFRGSFQHPYIYLYLSIFIFFEIYYKIYSFIQLFYLTVFKILGVWETASKKGHIVRSLGHHN